jgi:hypothetical protein
VIAQTEQQLANFARIGSSRRPPVCSGIGAEDYSNQEDPAIRWRFEQGELSRRVLDALRQAGELIGPPDVVRAVMIDKGLDSL